MLLSYKKPVTTNSGVVTKEINVVDESDTGFMLEQIKDFQINKINDEEIQFLLGFWSEQWFYLCWNGFEK